MNRYVIVMRTTMTHNQPAVSEIGVSLCSSLWAMQGCTRVSCGATRDGGRPTLTRGASRSVLCLFRVRGFLPARFRSPHSFG
jgi:hypothetical protein